MVEEDPAFGQLIWSNKRTTELISECQTGEIHFLVLPHPFEPFRLVPFVKRWPCLGFLDGRYFSQHFAIISHQT